LDNLSNLGDMPSNNPIDGPSQSLAIGLQYFARGEYAEAITIWETVAADKTVAGFIARHNLACATGLRNSHAASGQLRALLGVYETYDSTILYNLAHLMRWQQRQEEADLLLAEAVENDISVYRIRQSYRAVIAGLSALRGIQILDLSGILDPQDFVDYCHPTDKGHEKIAHMLSEVILSDERPAQPSEGSSYEVRLPTPNYVRAPDQTLCDYYCIDWPTPQARIEATLRSMASQPGGGTDGSADRLRDCIRNFLQVNSDHPIFTENIRLVDAWAPRSHEIFSCPENYIYRLMYNYSTAFEKEATAKYLVESTALETVRMSSNDYKRISLRANEESLETEIDVRREYYDAIVRKTIDRLSSADRIYRVVIGERIRTLMTWYTREALRYGTQSRMSMLYPCWDIEKFVEGLLVAVVIAARQGEQHEFRWLDELLSIVLQLLDVHERHVRLYHREEGSFSVGGYQKELDDVRRRIEASVAGSCKA
jgi:hypothetical protein